MLSIGTETRWGKIEAVTNRGGERYYMMADKHGGVALMPATTVEASLND